MRNQPLKALIRIEARAAGPAKDDELLPMLQALLADRFQLAFHRDKKLFSGYSLVVAKRGALKIQPDQTEGGSRWDGGRGKIVAHRVSMTKLAESLCRILESPVVDNTGTNDLFSFTLEWTPDNQPNADAGPSIVTALQQQLGLKLQPARVSMDVLSIEKAEKPSEN